MEKWKGQIKQFTRIADISNKFITADDLIEILLNISLCKHTPREL